MILGLSHHMNIYENSMRKIREGHLTKFLVTEPLYSILMTHMYFSCREVKVAFTAESCIRIPNNAKKVVQMHSIVRACTYSRIDFHRFSTFSFW